MQNFDLFVLLITKLRDINAAGSSQMFICSISIFAKYYQSKTNILSNKFQWSGNKILKQVLR